jgi:SAM-dependent methyltransferase
MGEAAVVRADSGRYPIELRSGEIERLEIQSAAMAADAEIMLERIGVGPGWTCLDMGCGPGGITDLLSARVGPSGRVVGLDANADLLDYARSRGFADVEFVQGNAYETGLAGASVDFVHMRFLASTAGQPERLLREAMRVSRPGGIVALEEPDMATLTCHPPHAAWDVLRGALIGAFTSVGSDISLARSLYALARRAGLEDVQYRPFLVGVRANDPMNDYLPATVESLRGTILEQGLLKDSDLESALADCRIHLRDPDTVFTTYTVAQVWGRTPNDSRAEPP